MRQHRRRQRAGIVPLQIEISVDIIEALLLSGFVDDRCSEDRAELAVAVSSVLTTWARIWLKRCNGVSPTHDETA